MVKRIAIRHANRSIEKWKFMWCGSSNTLILTKNSGGSMHKPLSCSTKIRPHISAADLIINCVILLLYALAWNQLSSRIQIIRRISYSCLQYDNLERLIWSTPGTGCVLQRGVLTKVKAMLQFSMKLYILSIFYHSFETIDFFSFDDFDGGSIHGAALDVNSFRQSKRQHIQIRGITFTGP